MLCCIFRYELPQPTANQKHDITSWTEAVENSMAQLEHQAERQYYHIVAVLYDFFIVFCALHLSLVVILGAVYHEILYRVW